MAFNHVGQCCCPVGCCDCGPSSETDLAIIYDPKNNELYLWDVTGAATRVDIIAESWGHIYIDMLIPKTTLKPIYEDPRFTSYTYK